MEKQPPIARFVPVRLERDAPLGGAGNNGQVYKAMFGELPCAAKLLRSTIANSEQPDECVFEMHCRFLSQIHHPNIVQYLGMYRDEAPFLLMELMDDSLTHFLELSETRLPYHVQVNINYDIAQALAFLHTKPIWHCNLSSNNVLLIGAGIRAKVTDFAINHCNTPPHSNCLATPAYMPPEALQDSPTYTEKLDSFQEGVLMVQIITRKFPDPGPAMIPVRDERYPTGWVHTPVPEIERRNNHLRLVMTTHPMFSLAVDCLNDSFKQRPSAQQICHFLSALKVTPQYQQSLEAGERGRDGDMIQWLQQDNAEKERMIQEKDQQIQKLQQELQQKEAHLQKVSASLFSQ